MNRDVFITCAVTFGASTASPSYTVRTAVLGWAAGLSEGGLGVMNGNLLNSGGEIRV